MSATSPLDLRVVSEAPAATSAVMVGAWLAVASAAAMVTPAAAWAPEPVAWVEPMNSASTLMSPAVEVSAEWFPTRASTVADWVASERVLPPLAAIEKLVSFGEVTTVEVRVAEAEMPVVPLTVVGVSSEPVSPAPGPIQTETAPLSVAMALMTLADTRPAIDVVPMSDRAVWVAVAERVTDPAVTCAASSIALRVRAVTRDFASSS